ncbi:MAG: hypothetical protein WC378_00815 [Opitutaceae bacterium]|jgi:hypothetical protein
MAFSQKLEVEIRSIEAEIARLEVQLNGRKQELAEAYNARKWFARVTDGKKPGPKKRVVEETEPKRPSGSANPKANVSMAGLIREVVLRQTSQFTVTDIVSELRKQHPDVAARLPQNYCGIQLWKLSGSGIINVIRRGEKGTANIYAPKNS